MHPTYWIMNESDKTASDFKRKILMLVNCSFETNFVYFTFSTGYFPPLLQTNFEIKLSKNVTSLPFKLIQFESVDIKLTWLMYLGPMLN